MAAIPISLTIESWQSPQTMATTFWHEVLRLPVSPIIHGDLRPENIIIRDWNDCGFVVCDFDFDDFNSPVKNWKIEQSDLPDGEPYQIVNGIPVSVVRNGDLEFQAAFGEANIAIAGASFRDAFQALVYEILDMFDFLNGHESELGPEPIRQLNILKQHIAQR